MFTEEAARHALLKCGYGLELPSLRHNYWLLLGTAYLHELDYDSVKAVLAQSKACLTPTCALPPGASLLVQLIHDDTKVGTYYADACQFTAR